MSDDDEPPTPLSPSGGEGQGEGVAQNFQKRCQAKLDRQEIAKSPLKLCRFATILGPGWGTRPAVQAIAASARWQSPRPELNLTKYDQ